MRIPTMRGMIDRRILVNYHVDPDALVKLLPWPFRPKLINGFGMAGICLIRLKYIRPRLLPSFVGVSSENAAHRIAVEWNQNARCHEGVFVRRRDTSSRLNTLVGGRVFPGVHHHARFRVHEQGDQFRVSLNSDDAGTHVAVNGRITSAWPATSVFQSLEEASRFFERGSLGYSVTNQRGCFDGLELHTFGWHVEPLAVDSVESSFFEDQRWFPAGSVEFDCALLMRHIEHEWHGRPTLRAPLACQPAHD